MNRIIIYIFAATVWFTAQAQEDTFAAEENEAFVSKKGIPILPEAGEWAIGISASPLLQYLGNLANSNVSNGSPSFSAASQPSRLPVTAIFGKIMLSENTAIRGRFQYFHSMVITKAAILQSEINPDPEFPAFTEDWRKSNTSALTLTGGLEKRRGSGRVQGVYGGEVLIGLRNDKITYEYGNSFSADFNEPITNNYGLGLFTGNITNFGAGSTAQERVIEEVSGGNWFFGLRGFIGVEYFVGPKISLGGEFGYTIGMQSQGKGSFTTEEWDPLTASIRETTNDQFSSGGNLNYIGAGLDNLSGLINVLFYF